jgi:hypothetical protein
MIDFVSYSYKELIKLQSLKEALIDFVQFANEQESNFCFATELFE